MPTLELEPTLPDPLPADPFQVFVSWFDAAHAAKIQPNPNAMTLATVDVDGSPSARIVLCKGIDAAGGSIVFFTNYEGGKARALAAHPRAAVVFHWDAFDRQVRMAGPVVKATTEESDEYFRSRPWFSRIGAWTSRQSEPVASREALAAQLDETLRRFGIDPSNLPAKDAAIEIPRPEHWGGYRIHAERVELWIGAKGRLHDRAEWRRRVEIEGAGRASGVRVTPWLSTRVQP